MTGQFGKLIAEVGGPVDECGVCLAIYGVDLDPEEVSRELGCEPTHAHRRGDKQGPRSPGFKQGAWVLEVRGFPPRTADILLEEILQKVPADPALWSELGKKYDVQLRFGIHMSGWNKGLSLSSRLIERLSHLNASLEFDIYTYKEDELLEKKPAS